MARESCLRPADDLWIWDLDGETLSRLTFDAGADGYGVWTPDGQTVIFRSDREGDHVFSRAADGTGAAERLTEAEAPLVPMTIAPDGSVIVAREGGFGGGSNLVTVSRTGEPVSEYLLRTEFGERSVAISPDGQWFAYEANTSGNWEVYVSPFPDAEGGQQCRRAAANSRCGHPTGPRCSTSTAPDCSRCRPRPNLPFREGLRPSSLKEATTCSRVPAADLAAAMTLLPAASGF